MIHVLVGSEPYLVKKEKECLEKIVSEDMNLSRHDEFTKETEEECYTQPFLEDKRVVIVETDNISKLNNTSFLHYIDNPSDFTELVILPKEYDGRTKFYQSLKKKGFVKVFDKLEDEQKLIQFIGHELMNNKAAMTKEALGEFLTRENYFENEDVNLYSIVNDLNTLLSLTKQIELSHVRDYVKANEVGNIFVLGKLLLNKDAKALRHETKKLNSESSIGTISLLLREYRIALKAKNFDIKDIGAKFVLFKDMDEDALLRGIEICLDAISQVKDGNLSNTTALDLTVSKLLTL